MKNRSVSVIIPAYNVENSLAKCIDSVFSQVLQPEEVIVVNDGSTDKTVDVVKAYGQRVVYIEQENQGQGGARNAGLAKAEGQYIAFLDADDFWDPHFLETCIAFLEHKPEAVAVNTAFRVKRLKDEYVGPENLDEISLTHPTGLILDNFFDFWGSYDHVRTGTVLIRHEVIKKAGYQRADLRISQDLEYWGYIATFGPWGFIPKVLWIGDSASAAVKQGWGRKYKIRRKLCPTVDSWEYRIRPRLKNHEVEGFELVRGRVAAGYAHNKILAGNFAESLEIIKKYGSSLPENRLTKLMKINARLGSVGWAIACWVIQLREFIKG
jgi:glycosyltransferase involved in cell wall biosynthesis